MKGKKEIRLDFYYDHYEGDKVLNAPLGHEKSPRDEFALEKYFYDFCEAYFPKLVANFAPLEVRWWIIDVSKIYQSVDDDTFIKLYLNGKYRKTDSKILYKKHKRNKDAHLVKDERWKVIRQKEYTDDKYYDDLDRYNFNLYKELIEYYRLHGFDEIIYIYEDISYCSDLTARANRGANWKLSLLIYNFAYQMFHESDKDIRDKQTNIKFKKYKICYDDFFKWSEENSDDLDTYYQARDEYLEQELYNKVYEDYKKNGLDKIIIPIPAFYFYCYDSFTKRTPDGLEPFEFYSLDWGKSIETYKKACKELNGKQETSIQSQTKELTYTNEFDNQNNYSNEIAKSKVRTLKKGIK